MPILDRITIRLAGLAVAVALSACATPSEREAGLGHVVAPGAAGSLRGATVLVACQASDASIRDTCRDQLADEITVRGGRPVTATERADGGVSPTDDSIVGDARTAGATAVLLMVPTPVAVAEPGPSVSIGIGGIGFGRGGGVGGGVGVTTPIGEPRVATAFAATGRVIDVASGRTLWTARARVPPSADLPSQFGSLAIALMDVASRDGLF